MPEAPTAVTTILRDVDGKFREIELQWIPMSDGRRLAARLWIPNGADATPVPAILEYIPYRRRDGTRLGDDPMHGWFAAQRLCLRPRRYLRQRRFRRPPP